MDLIPSDVKDVLLELNDLSKRFKIPQPYLVGGYFRNLYLSEEKPYDDLDITTNSGPNSLFLGIILSKEKNLNFNIYERKHASLFYKSKKIDFSSGFISENLPSNIDEYLKEPMSRDFTVNTIHVDCSDFKIYDFTGRGISDLENRILNTVMSPDKTLVDDPKRVFRCIYQSSKHNLKISNEIINFCRKFEDINLFISKNTKFVTSIIDDCFDESEENTLNSILEMNIASKIPLFGRFREHLLQNDLLEKYFRGEL